MVFAFFYRPFSFARPKLLKCKSTETQSKSYKNIKALAFVFTVFGMRYPCKMRELPYEQYQLPQIRHEQRLPVVLSGEDIQRLLGAQIVLCFTSLNISGGLLAISVVYRPISGQCGQL
jgi:hypothetical protein